MNAASLRGALRPTCRQGRAQPHAKIFLGEASPSRTSRLRHSAGHVNIVILAAGIGKRMRSDVPKVLHPLAGRPMVGHVLATVRQLRPRQLIGVYGFGGEAVPNAMASEDVTWVLQAPQLGTGHALQKAVPYLDDRDPTLVVYGDVPLIRAATLKRLMAAAGRGAFAVLTVELADPDGYGRIVREGGHVRRIVEHRDASAAERSIVEVNTGILVAPTPSLKRWLALLSNDNAQQEYYLTDVIAMAAQEGVHIASAQPDAPWEVLGINSKAQLAALERQYQLLEAQRLMEDGVTLADPARIDVRGKLTCGRDVSIDIGCIFEGEVRLGDRVTVGAHCLLRDVEVKEDATIREFSHVEGAVIGRASRVGPYARLRPGTRLGAEVHIGNFVEVKQTRMGDGAKANHLAYLGDSTVGKRSNVGAGTITCNFDGANKHKTVIGDDVHIGSDTQLVAPVKVGKGATIGAGTTVWKNVPANTLVVNEKTQVARSGWRRPAKRRK